MKTAQAPVKLVEAYIPCRYCDYQHVPLLTGQAGFKFRAKCPRCQTFYGFHDKAMATRPGAPPPPPEKAESGPPEPDMTTLRKVQKAEVPAVPKAAIDWRKYEV